MSVCNYSNRYKEDATILIYDVLLVHRLDVFSYVV
jgi:hypothetical protein